MTAFELTTHYGVEGEQTFDVVYTIGDGPRAGVWRARPSQWE